MATSADSFPNTTNGSNKTGPTMPPAPPGANRKKQKRRAKQAAAARQASEFHAPPSDAAREIPRSLAAYDEVDGDFDDAEPPELLDADDQYFTDEDSHYPPPLPTNGMYAHEHGAATHGKKRSKKKKKQRAGSTPPPPPSHLSIARPRAAIWHTSSAQERKNIKEFWLSLSEEQRKSLVKIEKEAVLRKMKEQQRHSCSCTVCGRKRTAIEEELTVLYDAYYEELEQGRIQELADDTGGDGLVLDEELSEDDLSEDEEVLDPVTGPAADLFNFGNSLTVQGGILTVADDLLKNDGKKFIDMMEQLAERRMQREEEAQSGIDEYSHPSAAHFGHSPEEEYDDEDDYDSQEEEDYDEDDMEAMTEQQRMDEGRRMFQIFAARMFEQRVEAAFREDQAKKRQEALILELENQEQDRKDKQEKKAQAAQKKKEKKQIQKQAKASEKAKKEAEKAAEEADARAAEERRLEEQKKKREEQRKKKEMERKTMEEEKKKKDAERAKRLQDERERQQDMERKAREQKVQEKRAKEDARRKDQEFKEAEQRKKEEQRKKQESEVRLKAKAEKDSTVERSRKESTVPPASKTGGKRMAPAAAIPALPKTAPSPQVAVATPAIMKMPPSNRPRQISRNSHSSPDQPPQHAVPQTASSQVPIANKPISPQAFPPALRQQPPVASSAQSPTYPAHVSHVPLPPLNADPSLYGGAALAQSGTLPTQGMWSNQLHHPLSSGLIGAPQVGGHYPNAPQPGRGVAGVGLRLDVSAMPDHSGSTPTSNSSIARDTMPTQSHSRQHSATYDQALHSGSMQSMPPPASSQPLHRPAPIQRPSVTSHQPLPIGQTAPSHTVSGQLPTSPRPAHRNAEVDELTTALGSSALIGDDEPDVPQKGFAQPTPSAPGSGFFPSVSNFSGNSGVVPVPFAPASTRTAPSPWGASPTGGHWSRNNPFGIGVDQGARPAMPLGSEPSGTADWSRNGFMSDRIPAASHRAMTSVAPVGVHPTQRPSMSRAIWLRLLMCRLFTDKARAGIDLLAAGDVLRVLNEQLPASEGQVSWTELSEVCETEGNSHNGGGNFLIRDDPVRGVPGISFVPDDGTPGAHPPGHAGDIGSPLPGMGMYGAGAHQGGGAFRTRGDSVGVTPPGL